MSNYKAKGLSRKNLGDMSRYLRKKMGLEFTIKIDIIAILEFIVNDILDYNTVIVDTNEMPEFEGKTYPNKKEIQIREDIYCLAIKGNSRARHTIAHEMFHALCHKESFYTKVDNNYKIPKYEDPEWQADAFAGEFLAPSYLLGNKTVDEIMTDFGVSRACAEIQYKNKNKVLGL